MKKRKDLWKYDDFKNYKSDMVRLDIIYVDFCLCQKIKFMLYVNKC